MGPPRRCSRASGWATASVRSARPARVHSSVASASNRPALGYDIGWTLAWVLKGWAGADLLDTYESERRVVAEHNLDRSTDPDGTRRSTLDLLGPGWTLFAGPRWTGSERVPSPAPVTTCVLDAVTARALGLRGDGALLAA